MLQLPYYYGILYYIFVKFMYAVTKLFTSLIQFVKHTLNCKAKYIRTFNDM